MKWLLIPVLIFFSTACQSPNEIPNDIMGIDTMKVIVWDMAHAGALAQNQYKKDTPAIKQKTIEFYQQVFTIHGITKDEFYKSNRYYMEHPDKHKILMDSVNAYANNRRGNMYKKLE